VGRTAICATIHPLKRLRYTERYLRDLGITLPKGYRPTFLLSVGRSIVATGEAGAPYSALVRLAEMGSGSGTTKRVTIRSYRNGSDDWGGENS
jgi:hypothetical protein